MISLPTLTWLVPRGSSAPLWTWRWSPKWKWPRPRTAVRIPAFRFISDRHIQMTNLLVALGKLNAILVSSIRDSIASQVAKGAHLRVKPHCFPRVIEKPKICECFKKIFWHMHATNLTPHPPLALPWTWTIWARIFPASLLSLIWKEVSMSYSTVGL